MSLSEKYSQKVPSDALSMTSRATSDYFPRSYKRPAPYLLWDDNIVPIHIDRSSSTSSSSPSSPSLSCSASDFSVIRLLMTILITLAAVGVVVVVAAAVYLGVITSDLMEEVTNEQSFDGRLHITRGDSFFVELANTSSLEFQLKARRYETMLSVLLRESPLKDGYKDTEVIGFKQGSLMVFFRVHLDRRKVQLKSTHDMAVAIQKVIAEDASKKSPRALKNITVDVDSIWVRDLLYKKSITIAKDAFKTTPRPHPRPTTFSPRHSTVPAETSISSERTQPTTTITDATTEIGNQNGNEGQTATENKAVNVFTSSTKIQPLNSTSTSTSPTTWRPLRRPQALTLGVASEIPFSLSEFLAYEAGFRDQAKSASTATAAGHYSSATDQKPSDFVMEANVGAVLLLRNSPQSYRNGSEGFLNPGHGTSHLRPVSSALPPWRWREGTSNTSSSTRRRQRPMTSTMRSASIFVPPMVAMDGVRVTSPPLMHGAVSSSQTPPVIISGGETVVQSNNIFMKSSEKLISELQSPSVSVSLSSSTVALTTRGWIPVAALNWQHDRSTQPPTAITVTASIKEEQHTSGHLKPVMATLERDIDDHTGFHSSDVSRKDVLDEIQACKKPGNFACRSGGCVSHTSRCDQMRDCSDNSDEDDCTCVDYLYGQFLSEKICDGVVDCWDYSDENRCADCSPEMYVCPHSSVCIPQDKICDAAIDCPGGEDEKQCVRVAANESLASDGHYHKSGYLMVRKNGKWGHLCIENFSRFELRASSSTTLGLTQLASAVCRTLTFSDYVSVERKKAPLEPRSYDNRADSFYRLSLMPSNAVRNVLEFNKTSCQSRDVIWMQCKNLECGVRPMAPATARIVGGSNALAGSWPWQVAMYKSGEYMCGATLINDQWLLSAAHCFYNEVNNYWTARLGMLRRGSQAPHEQIHVVSNIVMHPQYVKVGFVNDVALLRLQTAATFRPVCLPPVDVESVYDGRVCTVVGWGQLLETGHVFPDTLQEVELPIFPSQECRKKTVFLQTYQITENMFCAGYDRGGRDACLGDSGGPLVCRELSGKWTLVGITSNGFGCARAWRPGIYTKVSNYVDWIQQVMDGPLRTPIRSHCRGHRCKLGKCLPANNVCNGFVECADGSDERGCHGV